MSPQADCVRPRSLVSTVAVRRPRRITHHPLTSEEFLLGTVTSQECRFVLDDQLPAGELPFEPLTGRSLDLHYITEAMHTVAQLAANRSLRMPPREPLTAVQAAVTIENTELWRHTGQPGHATVETRLRTSRGAPRRLRCEANMFVRGARYAEGVLLLTGTKQKPAAEEPASGHPASADPVPRPCPANVARVDPRNVVLANTRFSRRGHLSADVAPDRINAAFDPAATRRAAMALTVEASRQAAVLVADEVHGFLPRHCVPTRWRATGLCGRPSRCTAVAGPLFQDAKGRPAVTVEVCLTDYAARTAVVRSTLIQDC